MIDESVLVIRCISTGALGKGPARPGNGQREKVGKYLKNLEKEARQ